MAPEVENVVEHVKTCPVCGRPAEPGWKLCPQCGSELDPGAKKPRKRRAAASGELREAPPKEPEYEPENVWLDMAVDALRIVGRVISGVGVLLIVVMFQCVGDSLGGSALFGGVFGGGVLVVAGSLLLALNRRARKRIKKMEHPGR